MLVSGWEYVNVHAGNDRYSLFHKKVLRNPEIIAKTLLFGILALNEDEKMFLCVALTFF